MNADVPFTSLSLDSFASGAIDSGSGAFSNCNYPATLIDSDCPIKFFESNPRYADANATRAKLTVSDSQAVAINNAMDPILSQWALQFGSSEIKPVAVRTDKYGWQISVKIEHDTATGLLKEGFHVVAGDRGQALTVPQQLQQLQVCSNLLVQPMLYHANGTAGITLKAKAGVFPLNSACAHFVLEPGMPATHDDGVPVLQVSGKTMVNRNNECVCFPVESFDASVFVSEDKAKASIVTSNEKILGLAEYLDTLFVGQCNYVPLVKHHDKYGRQARLKFEFEKGSKAADQMSSSVRVQDCVLRPYVWNLDDSHGVTLFLNRLEHSSIDSASLGGEARRALVNLKDLISNDIKVGPVIDKTEENRLPLVYFSDTADTRLSVQIGDKNLPTAMSNPPLPDAYQRPDTIPNLFVGLQSREVEHLEALEGLAKQFVQDNKDALFGADGESCPWTDDQISDSWQDCIHEENKVKLKVNASIAQATGANGEQLPVDKLPFSGSGYVIAQPYLYFNGDVRAKGKKKRKLNMCGLKLSALHVNYSYTRPQKRALGETCQLGNNLQVTLVDDLIPLKNFNRV